MKEKKAPSATSDKLNQTYKIIPITDSVIDVIAADANLIKMVKRMSYSTEHPKTIHEPPLDKPQ